MNGKGVHRIDDMIAPANVGAQLANGDYGRAVSEPFWGGLLARFRPAWEVLAGRAHAIEWPTSDDLNRALRRQS